MELIQSFLTNNPCYQANLTQADSRYTAFQARGPLGLMLHSVGCAQPRASVFVSGWNRADYDKACVHAFIDGKTGTVYQTLPWSFRAWHCGGSGNDSFVGVELCETDAIRYTGANRFEVTDRETALADCARTWAAAVELFAALCVQYDLDPLTAISSHKEGHTAGIASNHGDPEHYWSGLGTGYTMDGFRAAVAAAMGRTALPEPAPQAPDPAEPNPEDPTPDPMPSDADDPGLPFPDVPDDAWYADALRWAVEKHIVQPSEAPFRPDNPLTKAAAVVWLRRLWNALQV